MIPGQEGSASTHYGSSTRSKVETTIGIDLGDASSHYCTLNQGSEVVDRGRFMTTPKEHEKWFTDPPSSRIATEAEVHLISISEPLRNSGTK